jgi:hypothetical protein
MLIPSNKADIIIQKGIILQDLQIGMVGPSRNKTHGLVQAFTEVYLERCEYKYTKGNSSEMCRPLRER